MGLSLQFSRVYAAFQQVSSVIFPLCRANWSERQTLNGQLDDITEESTSSYLSLSRDNYIYSAIPGALPFPFIGRFLKRRRFLQMEVAVVNYTDPLCGNFLSLCFAVFIRHLREMWRIPSMSSLLQILRIELYGRDRLCIKQ